MRGRGILGAIVVVWLLIGVFAAWQRDYFKGGPTNCATAAIHRNDSDRGTVELQGVNPASKDCRCPRRHSYPSQSSDLVTLEQRKLS